MSAPLQLGEPPSTQRPRLRIGVFTGTFPVASETFIAQQVAGLLECGQEVEIVAQRRGEVGVLHPVVRQYDLLSRARFWPDRPRNPALRLLKGAGLWAAGVGRSPRAMLRALNVVRYGRRAASFDLVFGTAALRDRGYDLLHCHFGPTGLLAAQLKEIGAIGCPLVVTFHGSDALVTPRRAKPGFYAPLFRQADRCTAGTRFMEQRLIELGAPPERLARVPMGIDLDEFSFTLPSTRAAGDAVRLITVARLVEFKGIEYSLRALAQLAPWHGRPVREHPPLTYEVIGGGPLAGELEALARSLGIAERVTFTGPLPQDEVRRRLASADIFVLAGVEDSRGQVEGQGVVLAEAQALGLPVVASRIGGIPECLPACNHAWLAEPKDVAGLAQRISRLIEQRDQWDAIALAGRRHVEQEFDQRTISQRWIELYQRVISGPSAVR